MILVAIIGVSLLICVIIICIGVMWLCRYAYVICCLTKLTAHCVDY